MSVAVKPWRPGVARVSAGFSSEALNVVPRIDGFAPFPAPAVASVALAAQACGLATLFDDANVPRTYAGTSTNLYLAVNSTPVAIWTDVSRLAGGAYTADTAHRWQFASFGTLGVAVNLANEPQSINLTSGSNFANLGGSPPRAKFVKSTQQFVILAHLSTNARIVQWSGLNNATFWTPGSQSSDLQEVSSGGPITGLAGSEVISLFQESAIKQMRFSPGSSTIFDVTELETERGCVAPWSLVELGGLVFFLARDGFMRLTAQGAIPIGANKIDKYFRDNVKQSNISGVEGLIDPINYRVYWAYQSPSASGTFNDRVLCYDWTLDEWTRAEINTRVLGQFVAPGYTLDGLDALGYTMETLPYSLDSSYWYAASRSPALIGSDNILYTLSGAPLGVTVEISDFEPVRSGRAYVRGCQLDVDTTAATLSVGARDRLGDAITWKAASPQQTSGYVPLHCEGRYIRGRIAIPSGTTWTALTGLDPDYVRAGD